MANKPITILQKLNTVFTNNGYIKPSNVTNKYNLSNDIVFKTKSKDEYDAKKLEQQQHKFLKSQWRKVDSELLQKSLYFESTRIASYSDFEAMEAYPEIGTALDILAEESTTPNDKGKILNVYSNSPRIKGVLEDLFFNKLDIHLTLPMWTRNTVKYGDNFLLLNIDSDNGIVGAKQLPNYEIERKEGDIVNINTLKINNNNELNFHWRGKDLDFKSWQIAHFRLLFDDRRIPYGTSILEKCRKIWKELCLAEDAMLVYRVTRAPERRVYKIFVGNIDDEDVGAYVDDIANRFKRTSVIDPATGQIDNKYNILGNDQDFFIPVRDENAPTPIDTLPGAANLSDIEDIQYLQRKLFTALKVPKTFLGFDESNGEGKNLALQDIRFSRTINRIQQTMLSELNKIAIIHLTLLGFDDDLGNFTLTLNNPSTQAEMLKIEHLQTKMTLYKDAVSDAGNGFMGMSMTRAKREILGWSDDEIKQDLLEQRMEKAAASELENTNKIIKYTGTFDKVDKLYGDIELARSGGGSGDEEGGESDAGGSTSGGGFGGGGLDFGDESALGDEGSDATNEEGNDAETDIPEESGDEPALDLSSVNKRNNLITERKNIELLYNHIGNVNNNSISDEIKLFKTNDKINKSISEAIINIDKTLDE